MKKPVLSWLWAVPGSKKLYVLALIFTQSFDSAAGVLYALLLRAVVDGAVAGSRTAFRLAAAETVALVLCQQLMRAVARWLYERARSDMENCFKLRLFENLLRRDYAMVSAVHSGEWLNRLTNDAVVVANGIVEMLPGLIGMLVKLLSAVAMIVVLEARFAALVLPVGLGLVLLTYGFRRRLKTMHKAIQEKDGALRIFLQERLGSMMILRAFAAEEQSAREAAARMGAHKAARLRRIRFSALCSLGFGLAINGMYLFAVIYCGYGILTGALSFGTLTAMTALISQLQAPFSSLSGYLPRFYAMTASAERLMEIETFGEDAEEPAASLPALRDYYAAAFAALGLEGASFTYYPAAEGLAALSKENAPVTIRKLSLRVGRGEYVAFTGHSGCGKSTVLKLLMSLYRLDEGERLLFDKDGTSRPLTARERRLFAYVPQGNQLMSGTLREAVAFAEPEAAADDARLWRALRIACAEDFVRELEDGLDTRLGERGTGLSEGQMQRLAIARAIFSDSPILLLDEATSALDGETERRLLENLRSMTDRTVVIVTHRPAALDICDRVLLFTEEGVLETKPEPHLRGDAL